jgi:hypothetical protein
VPAAEEGDDMPTIEYRPRVRVRPECNWLIRHAKNITSQAGQDGILQKIFDVIGVESRWCVEFGAWDGKHLSNTWSLIANAGWNGVLIEGAREKFTELLRTHSGHRVDARNAYVGWEGPHRLDAILATTAIPQTFDLLCIDIDGNDWHVWAAVSQYRPRVVCIEFNPTISSEIVFVQDPDPAVNQGCSLLALVELAKKKGYELVCAAPFDAIFVTAELYARFQIPDNDVECMWHPQFYETRLWQGYDGTFWAAGNLQVWWKQIPLDAAAFQVLPRSLRRFK